MTQYLLSVHMVEGEETPHRRRDAADVQATSTCSTRSSRTRAPGCSPVACTRPTPPRSSASQNGESLTTDGPFAEAKEQLGGFWVIKAPDLDAALALAAEGTAACGPVEVRPFQDEPTS